MRKAGTAVQEAQAVPSLPALRPLDTPSPTSPASTYVAGLAPGSRRAQASALVRVARLFGIDDPNRVPWHALRIAHVKAIRARLLDGEEKTAPATVNRILAAVKGTLRAAWE